MHRTYIYDTSIRLKAKILLLIISKLLIIDITINYETYFKQKWNDFGGSIILNYNKTILWLK